MGAVYTVERLPTDKVDQAYPLIHVVEPRLDLDEWRRSYQACTSGDGQRTIFAACGATGYLHGLCIVEIVAPPDNAPYIVVSKLVIDTALDSEGVASAVLQGLGDYASSQGCSRLRISIEGTDEAALVALARARAGLPAWSLTIEMY